jgi:hypothetical protein
VHKLLCVSEGYAMPRLLTQGSVALTERKAIRTQCAVSIAIAVAGLTNCRRTTSRTTVSVLLHRLLRIEVLSFTFSQAVS